MITARHDALLHANGGIEGRSVPKRISEDIELLADPTRRRIVALIAPQVAHMGSEIYALLAIFSYAFFSVCAVVLIGTIIVAAIPWISIGFL